MGGSVIGLFGDFGDGWVAVSHRNGEALEFGGVNLYERNPYIFGLKDGNQRWNQAKVGTTYYDYHFQGITDLETFSTEPGNGKGNLLINGFGLQVQSKTGGVVSGQQGEAVTAKDLRDGSLGLSSAKDGVREISLEVKRVGIVSSQEGQVDQVVPLDDMCVVNVGGKNEVFMIFAGVKVKNQENKWVPRDANRFIKLNGCSFFGSLGKGKRVWLQYTSIGQQSGSGSFVAVEGNSNNVDGVIGWSGQGATIFREKLEAGEYGAVALVGIVADMTKFLPASKCRTEPGTKESFCQKNKSQLENYSAERFDQKKYKQDKNKFGEWVDPNNESGANEVATGKGWMELREKWRKNALNGWGRPGFRNWVTYQLKKNGWLLPKTLWNGLAWNFQDKEHAADEKTFTSEFKKQIAHKQGDAGSKYEWKKTAVMRHKKIKDLGKEF